MNNCALSQEAMISPRTNVTPVLSLKERLLTAEAGNSVKMWATTTVFSKLIIIFINIYSKLH